MDSNEQPMIQEMKELRRQLKQFQSITAALGEGVIVIDDQGRLTFMNPEAERLLGWQQHELSQAAAGYSFLQSGMTCGWQRGDMLFSRKDGTRFPVSYISTPLELDDHRTGRVIVFHDITAAKQAEAALTESRERYHSLIKQSSDIVYIYTPYTWEFQEANTQFFARLGYAEDEITGLKLQDIVVDSIQNINENVAKIMQQEHAFFTDRIYRCKDGSTINVDVNVTVVHYQQKKVIMASARDTTERKRQEVKLRLAAAVFENVLEGIIISDVQGTLQEANPAFFQMTGYTKEEVIGYRPFMLYVSPKKIQFHQELWERLTESGRWEGEIYIHRKNGRVFPALVSITVVKGADGQVSQYVATLRDATQQKKYEESMKQQAFHDPLTGLPNRLLLHNTLTKALAHAHAGNYGMAVMFLDLDNFKPVNDQMGHAVGDQMLQEVASRLISCIRTADTVARVGGDEFILILPGIGSTAAAAKMANKLVAAFQPAFNIDGTEYFLTLSIGISLYPDDGGTLQELLSHADDAMYQAKRTGKNSYRFFDKKE